MSPAHERESGRLAESFLQRIRAPHAIVERVLPLVLNHMASFEEATERAVRRLARRLAPENVDRLCVLMTADAMARPPRPPVAPESVKKIRRMAESMRIADAAPRPIVQGRHLLELGFAPGKDVGRWVRAAFEAQLEGEFSDLEGARAWLASKLASEKK